MQEIEELRRQGLSLTQIGLQLGIDRKTVRKYLKSPQTPRYSPRPRPAKGLLLAPHELYIHERLAAGVWNGYVLYRELVDQRGYAGKYTILSDYLRPLRKEAKSAAVRRFETPPGVQAQVDWGALGHIELADGRRLALSGFVMTLGHSRALFLDIATDQSVSTLLAMHQRAFEALGGIPRQILYDNMKTVVQGADERGETIWNAAFLDYGRTTGFEPRLCRPYRPQTKGKVESGIGYVRKSFLCGRAADSLEDLRRQASAWCSQVANTRVHGTTHRIVSEAWEEEKLCLQPLPEQQIALSLPAVREMRRVTVDAFVQYAASRYSVPWQLAGKEVEVAARVDAGRLEVWRGQERVAVHEIAARKHQVIALPEHHESIPFGSAMSRAKASIQIVDTGAPVVEVRSLAVYEALVAGGAS